MKKIFGALMIAVCIGMAMPAQAQIHFGVKGGLNLSKASFSNVGDNFKKDNFTGFFIGPMAEFNIPIVGLGVDAALLLWPVFILLQVLIFISILKRNRELIRRKRK